jgi:elongation factor 1-beta
VFDVKVYDAETDLDALATKVLALEINGLTWSKEVKKLDVAYGIQKLQIGCVIEDDKVLTDDIFDQITAWDEIVQSVDTVSMQKL